MNRPLTPTFHPIGEAAYAALDRMATVRSMAFALAHADIDLGDESQCLERLLVMKTPGVDPLYSRAEVDACLADALDGAREIRQHMVVSNAAL